jgi:hypothetical protein
MSCPFLFQQVEHNASGQVVMVAYQKVHAAAVKQCQESLEADIKRIITEGEAEIVFLDETESMWFGSVYNNKKRANLSHSSDSMEYAKRIKNLLGSPPKKRQQVKKQLQSETSDYSWQSENCSSQYCPPKATPCSNTCKILRCCVLLPNRNGVKKAK